MLFLFFIISLAGKLGQNPIYLHYLGSVAKISRWAWRMDYPCKQDPWIRTAMGTAWGSLVKKQPRKNNSMSLSKLQGSTSQFVHNTDLSQVYHRKARVAFTKKVDWFYIRFTFFYKVQWNMKEEGVYQWPELYKALLVVLSGLLVRYATTLLDWSFQTGRECGLYILGAFH